MTRNPSRDSIYWRQLLATVVILHYLSPTPSLSQLRPDNSLPDNSRLVPEGNQIRIEGGTVRGDNLFHSFQEFSIPESLEVHINNASTIETIITRVTGSNLSQLDGQLSANGTANLILINPNGIHFGETAQLSIGGAFLATTAEQIQFSDGSVWGTSAAQDAPLLSLSVPIGLQFGETPGPIVNRSGVRGLEAAQLSLLGGGVQVTGALGFAQPKGQVRSPHALELGSFGPGTLVNLDGQGRVADVAATSLGTIELTQGASLEGGEIRLLGDRLEMTDGAQILSQPLLEPFSGGTGATIAIEMQTRVDLEGGSRIISLNGPDVRIQTQQFNLRDNAAVVSQVRDGGQGGNMILEASEGITLTGSGFEGFNQYLAAMAGDLLQPGEVITGIFSQAVSGTAGDIHLMTDVHLNLQQGSIINQAVFESAQGGQLTFDVRGTLDVHESGILSLTLPNSRGSAADIRVNTNRFSLRDGGVLAGATFGDGDSGQITIEAQERVDLMNTRAEAFIPTGIFSNSLLGTGTAGDIDLVTTHLRGAAGGTIASNSGGFLANQLVREGGRGGNITIEARESVELTGLSEDGSFGSGISAATFGRFPSGNVTLYTPRLILQDGAGLSTETFGPADGGRLRVTANEIYLLGQAPIFGSTSGLTSTSGRPDPQGIRPDTTGAAGDIQVWSDRIVLRDEALFDVRSFGQGPAGNLEVTAREIVLDSRSAFNAQTASGPGGNIQVRSQHLQLRNGSSINTDAGTADGGNISLTTGTLVGLENSNITANALEGRGGQVRINAEGIFGLQFRDSPTDRSDITASSLLGPEFSGDVSINSPDLNFSAALMSLPDPLTNLVMVSNCSTGESRFIITGQRGLPQAPWTPATELSVWEDIQALPDPSTELPQPGTPSPQPRLVEAQALQFDDQGTPRLVGERIPQ
ncbi:filamentous hemagglutinin N-terminal domain-containing protein [Sodalinema gerasimenkoae]|uniref:filamentous hemagglutinin N-terminal domain-containing protein n=1 Tax=Sodalinema gerasimenkoae TaxID=2862348 RepID=UPI0013571B72|nr:filamentous hemagglutinin N-terminal domain-containing protein [Sodalinema gerasimenkoae]